VLLGYNYGTTSPTGVIMMTVTTILMGVLFGWLRLRSGSVFPSAFAHGALNASGGTLLAAFVPPAAGVAPSVLGWLLLALVVGALPYRNGVAQIADEPRRGPRQQDVPGLSLNT
jgi:hypothetical protein